MIWDSTNSADRDQRDGQRHEIYTRVNLGLLGLRELLDSVEHDDVDERNKYQSADERDAPERLHRGVLDLGLIVRQGCAIGLETGYGLHRHRVGYRVLDDVAGRRQQCG